MRRGLSATAVILARKLPIMQAMFQIILSFFYFNLVRSWRPFAPEPLKFRVCGRGKERRIDAFNDIELFGCGVETVVQLLALVLAIEASGADAEASQGIKETALGMRVFSTVVAIVAVLFLNLLPVKILQSTFLD